MKTSYDRKEEMESRYRALFENNHSVMMIVDPGDGRILDVNSAAARYYGWSQETLRHMLISDINRLTPDEIAAEMRRARLEEKKQFFFRHVRSDGSIRDVEVYSGPILYEGRRVLYSIVHDITDRVASERSLAESEARFRNLAERSPDGIFIGTGGYFQYVNPAACRLFGASGMGEISGKRILDRVHPDHVERAIIRMRQEASEEPTVFDEEIVLLRFDGTPFHAEVRTVGIDHWGKPSFLFYVRDITDQVQTAQKILFISYHDELTGLYNRRFYEEETRRLDTPRNLPLTLVIADVNGLKLVNDSFGHAKGDELLQKVAEAIQSACRADDIVARLGGDEFAVLLPKTEPADAESFIERIRNRLEGEKVGPTEVSVAFGTASKSRPDESFADAFKAAEDRMYRNKLHEGQSAQSRTVELVVRSLHEKNQREQRHSARVGEICGALAERLDMGTESVARCRLAGHMHDIGKIGVAESVLDKKGLLTEPEKQEVQQHPEIGFRILNPVTEFSEIAVYVLEHQERWDGSGYPRGLKGEGISLVARIIAVADAFDAMTRTRSYSRTLDETEAVEELQRCAGTQFDPEIVATLVGLVHEGRIHADVSPRADGKGTTAPAD